MGELLVPLSPLLGFRRSIELGLTLGGEELLVIVALRVTLVTSRRSSLVSKVVAARNVCEGISFADHPSGRSLAVQNQPKAGFQMVPNGCVFKEGDLPVRLPGRRNIELGGLPTKMYTQKGNKRRPNNNWTFRSVEEGA